MNTLKVKIVVMVDYFPYFKSGLTFIVNAVYITFILYVQIKLTEEHRNIQFYVHIKFN